MAHPSLEFSTPSGKVEFHSRRAEELGLPPLPEPGPEQEPLSGIPAISDAAVPPYPLVLCQGRTLSQFHGFYDNGKALPTLARHDPQPKLWISPSDAQARGLEEGAPIRIHNGRGAFQARAHVTERIPPGVVWMRDGWVGLNSLTAGEALLSDEAAELFPFSAGQATYEARVEVAAV